MAQQTLDNQQPIIRREDADFEIDRSKLRRDTFIERAGRVGLILNPIFTYFFLWAPILLLVLFSFNDSRGVAVWRGFTLEWYQNIFRGVVADDATFSTEGMLDAVRVSVVVATSATVVSTIIGTMAALALQRSTFPGKKFLDSVLYLPVVIPEITQGISLMVFFNTVFEFVERTSGVGLQRGFATVIIAHAAFNISYVVIVVRSRLANMNPRYEEAARDLGANEWRTFWRVTFPLLFPAILAGALLAFTLSLDDYVVTLFTRGAGTNTLTVFVYGLLKISVTPEINAISTLMLLVSTVLIGISLALQGRSAAER
ncbi:MAG: ABC transporter permease [Chloroflexota bacterium]